MVRNMAKMGYRLIDEFGNEPTQKELTMSFNQDADDQNEIEIEALVGSICEFAEMV